MRSLCLRLATLSAGVALLASCDTRLGMPAGLGGSSSNSGGGSTNLSISFNTPPEGISMVAGAPLIVQVVLHDDQQITSVALSGVTGTDLATATVRYGLVTIPQFRTGLTDTTISRTLQPIDPSDVAASDMRIVAIVGNPTKADTATRVVTLVSP